MGCGKSQASAPDQKVKMGSHSSVDPFAKYQDAGREGKIIDEDIVAYFNADEFQNFEYKPNWKEAIPEPTDPLLYSDSFPGSCRLEYVYGYRCEAARQHVHFTSDSRVVYPAGATLVLLDPETSKQSHIGGFFLKLKTDPNCPLTHNDEILAVACHPQRHIVASAQCDGLVFVWSLADRELPLSTFDACETVKLMSFAEDGRWLAVLTTKALQVWDWDNCCLVATKAQEMVADISWMPDQDIIYSAGKTTQ